MEANMLLNNQWITEESKEEIKKYLETNDNENSAIENMGLSKSNFKKGSLGGRS